jgi:hypothetical protein
MPKGIHNNHTGPKPKHGQGSRKKGLSPAYSSWLAMKRRCTYPAENRWKHYGGRGITICERWMKFENFYADMGDRPPGKTLDRWPNPHGNYEPGNCQWSTSHEQRVHQVSAAKNER